MNSEIWDDGIRLYSIKATPHFISHINFSYEITSVFRLRQTFINFLFHIFNTPSLELLLYLVNTGNIVFFMFYFFSVSSVRNQTDEAQIKLVWLKSMVCYIHTLEVKWKTVVTVLIYVQNHIYPNSFINRIIYI